MSIIGKIEVDPPTDELLQWSVSSSGQETIVAIGGEIDLAVAETLTQVLADAVAGHPAKLVIDMTDVTFMDSTGIQVLMIAEQAASEFGCRLAVRHATATIERTLEICGLRDLLLEAPHEDATGLPLPS